MCGLLFTVNQAFSQDEAIREEFADLSQWRDFLFKGIEKKTKYEIVEEDGDRVLKASSNGSASALIHRTKFDVYQYPVLTWSWKVENVYQKGDATRKQGDDYPLRIYILFEFDPDQAGLARRIKYELVKSFYGQFPPDSTLNYIWANQKHKREVLINTYVSRARMIPVRWGRGKTGQWMKERRNILEDYRAAFDRDPPAVASLAVMNDSDNTGEKSVSYLDSIRVAAPD
ncbi:MAG: DUF3047 domain-containing protein [Desulfohalobiaceae bacterium]|nr:DUF3047 domain-containing protein [Desulfohalobiaceae bacterium]